MASKPIVAGTDGSEESLRAVDWAAREAVLRGAPLRIVSAAALPPRMMSRAGAGEYDTVTDVIMKERDRALAAACRAGRQDGSRPADRHRLAERGARRGRHRQRRGRADARAWLPRHRRVHGPGARLGQPVRRQPRVLPGGGRPRRDHRTPTGWSAWASATRTTCGDALTFAFEEASLRGASLLALHAWHTPQTEISRAGDTFTAAGTQAAAAGAARHLEGVLDSCRAKYPDVPVSQEVVHGHPARALIGLSARADLVVIGRHAKHPGRPGPGSVRHAVLSHAHGPVVTVPSA